MSQRRIAIACQGGGSQCAFVAGALKALFARRVQDRYRIVGLSGTSGGAFTAALAWEGRVLLDADRTLHDVFSCASEGLYLVRPDGYIAARCAGRDLAFMRAYLARWLR